ncbi:hypothetical protein MYSTI_01849 [Myxococcus stipitatus DSM 14675]|uniref:GIY-YIG domain-containing protein n=1 Tax=Myxococcus stipitatus (strain DSM 14675 / JCM 12634 / Mx s8) TaxID=1278073 RepID=L7U323_MYXSD|nr:hypothetical protein [Myxococcus stipitatus]AGC43181.1 hypothetical protein MYSTI_01849 [Myxococcus stipitatus DSM 14675]
MNEWHEGEDTRAREGTEESFIQRPRTAPQRKPRGTTRAASTDRRPGGVRVTTTRRAGSKKRVAAKAGRGLWKPNPKRRWPRHRPWRFLGVGPRLPLVVEPIPEPPPEASPPPPPPPPRNTASGGSAPPPEPPPYEDDAPVDDVPEEPGDEPTEPDTQEELLTSGPRISWSKVTVERYPFTRFPDGGGVYVVEEEGRPLFVGATPHFQEHWRERLSSLYQMGFTRRGGRLLRPLTLWFARLQPNTPRARKQVQRALCQALPRVGVVRTGTLRNPGFVEEGPDDDLSTLPGLFPHSTWGRQAAQALRNIPLR